MNVIFHRNEQNILNITYNIVDDVRSIIFLNRVENFNYIK